MIRRSCTALAALVTLAAAGAALAGAASSTPTGATTATLEEVVVTARRREESLQDVPLAVTALSAADLQAQNVQSLSDITALTPNTKVNNGRATNSTINVYIRGVGQNDPLWGFEPGVGIYLDDVYLARPQAALLDVYDVERIEILRGPQGTLYGKNTIAGAIKYVTRDIAGPATLHASVTGGSYGERDFKLSASGPVVADHVYLGASVAYMKRDGFGHVVDDGAPRQYNHVGQDVSNKDVLAARANATFVWGASSKLRLVGDTVRDNSNAAGGQRLNNFVKPALPGTFDTRTDMPVDRESFRVSGVAGTYTQDLAADWAFKAVGAYREGKGSQFIDFDELNANLFQVPGQYRDHQASGELQANYTGSAAKGVAGLYYFNGTACGAFDASLGGFNLTSLTSGCVKTRSTAAYVDATWKLGEQLNLDVGARYNRDDKSANVFVAQYLGVLAANQSLFDSTHLPTGFTLLSVQTNYSNSRQFPNFSPHIGLDYHFTAKVMGYASYSRGFKSGGFDMRGNQTANPATANGYDAEIADNYELGVKTQWLDDRLQLNLTGFYAPYKDVQITTQQFQIVAGNPTNVTAVLNAGKQLNEGVELESAWRPTRPLKLTLNVGYLNSYFEDFIVGCTPAAAGCSVNASAFNKPLNAPRWNVAVGTNYNWELASGALSAHVLANYRSFTKVANTTVSVTDQPGYTVVDAGLAYTAGGQKWRIALEGKNIFDKAYRVAGYDFGGPGVGATGGLSQIGFYGAPRTVALTASYQY